MTESADAAPVLLNLAANLSISNISLFACPYTEVHQEQKKEQAWHAGTYGEFDKPRIPR